MSSDPSSAVYYLQCLGGVLCPASVLSSVKWVSTLPFIDVTGPIAYTHNGYYHVLVSLALQGGLGLKFWVCRMGTGHVSAVRNE